MCNLAFYLHQLLVLYHFIVRRGLSVFPRLVPTRYCLDVLMGYLDCSRRSAHKTETNCYLFELSTSNSTSLSCPTPPLPRCHYHHRWPFLNIPIVFLLVTIPPPSTFVHFIGLPNINHKNIRPRAVTAADNQAEENRKCSKVFVLFILFLFCSSAG